ncbi:ABC transporter permease [Deinococcus radiopugnans]|uniref:ABC transporter permease n=1 Tax=Deinococcus radiopugnans ATCC 19172 TaxID=585398 RepID=A0A5C4YBT8_9DEIO|nr:ABC transporter permease [Deinococcus radiopugnans]MBB6015202.1 peptide/nickel transport system permease protein [Deinococcus radiopugnans ATCC 19172]TNM73091.1 ABC transporter permease [Deinococcus radiopugnans ATCC 19172]
MLTFTASRVLQSLGVLLVASVFTFSLIFLLPADPARLVAGPSASVQTVNSIRQELGLDRPFAAQYALYLGNLLRGDLGRSYKQQTAVRPLIATRVWPTFQLMLGAVALELLLGLPLGIWAALRRGRWPDRLVMGFAFLGASAPQFWLGLSLVYLLAYGLNLFPLGGYGGLSHLFLPALTLGLGGAGWYARVIRSSLLEVLARDYVRTARAKGLSQSRVVVRHALRNAAPPIISMIGLDIGVFMGGVVVVESVFGWPGLGRLVWDAIRVVDIPVIVGVVIFSAVVITLANLLADLVQLALDPRIRYS